MLDLLGLVRMMIELEVTVLPGAPTHLRPLRVARLNRVREAIARHAQYALEHIIVADTALRAAHNAEPPVLACSFPQRE